MAAVSTAEAACSAFAEALGIGPTDGEPSPDALTELQRQRILIVIDNREHLEPISRMVERLRRIAPHLNILATSQEMLNAEEECVLRRSQSRPPKF
jgi:predicted ATPase